MMLGLILIGILLIIYLVEKLYHHITELVKLIIELVEKTDKILKLPQSTDDWTGKEEKDNG